MSEWMVAWCLASIGQLSGPLVLFRDPWEPVFLRVRELKEINVDLDGLVRWIDGPEDLSKALVWYKRAAALHPGPYDKDVSRIEEQLAATKEPTLE